MDYLKLFAYLWIIGFNLLIHELFDIVCLSNDYLPGFAYFISICDREKEEEEKNNIYTTARKEWLVPHPKEG